MKTSSFKCRYLYKHQIKSLTEELIQKHYGDLTPTALPIEVDYILEEEGFTLKPTGLILEDKVYAQLAIDGNSVYVRESDYSGDIVWRFRLLRFALGHELGHAIMHRYLVDGLRNKFEQSSAPDPIEAFIHMTQESLSHEEYAGFEWQANFFAGNLLVPDSMLNHLFDELINQYSEGEKIGMALCSLEEIYSLNQKLFSDLAEYFDVNPYTVFVRVSQEGLWDEFKKTYE